MKPFFLYNSNFFRNVATLMTGTTIAQAIPLGITPILTRLYSPEDFGVFAVFLSLSSILAVFVAGRYELAVLTPEDDGEAEDIFWLAVIVTLLITTILFAATFVGGEKIILLIGKPEIGPWLYFIPASALLLGLYQALNFKMTRKKHFADLAKSKIVQTGSMSIAQLSPMYGGAPTVGLIGGSIIGQFLLVCFLLRRASSKGLLLPSISKDKYIALANKYREFPLVSAWGALCDCLAVQLPVLILSKYFTLLITGQFSLVVRVLNGPMSLIGTSISQVFFQKISELQYTNATEIKRLTVRVFGILAIISLPMVLILECWGKELFGFFFGDDWAMAGNMAASLAIAIAVRFAVSPLSVVLLIGGNLRLGTLWQFIYLFTLSTTLFLSINLGLDKFIRNFVIHEVVLYSLYFYFIYIGAGRLASSHSK